MNIIGDTAPVIATRRWKGWCELCRMEIERGDRAVRYAVADGREMHTCREHAVCREIATRERWYDADHAWDILDLEREERLRLAVAKERLRGLDDGEAE